MHVRVFYNNIIKIVLFNHINFETNFTKFEKRNYPENRIHFDVIS